MPHKQYGLYSAVSALPAVDKIAAENCFFKIFMYKREKALHFLVKTVKFAEVLILIFGNRRNAHHRSQLFGAGFFQLRIGSIASFGARGCFDRSGADKHHSSQNNYKSDYDPKYYHYTVSLHSLYSAISFSTGWKYTTTSIATARMAGTQPRRAQMVLIAASG